MSVRVGPAPTLTGTLRHHARPLTGRADDYDGLLDVIGDTQFVLLGEASHGTHEFYAERARITRRLIEGVTRPCSTRRGCRRSFSRCARPRWRKRSRVRGSSVRSA